MPTADPGAWSQALIHALETLPHAARLVDVGCAMRGLFRPTTLWVTGTVWSDTDDEATNLELLAAVAAAAARALAGVEVRKSWVQLSVASASGDALRLSRLGLGATPSLEELRRHVRRG